MMKRIYQIASLLLLAGITSCSPHSTKRKSDNTKTLYRLESETYGQANTYDLKTKIPQCIEPEFDYWMRDTWVTLGSDNYYYMIGTTADPNRNFTGQLHCWDWNDGLYLWKSRDNKTWEALGLIWSFEKDATWQKEPLIKDNEKRNKSSINGDPLDNKYRAVWAPEIHYIKSTGNWYIVACLNASGNNKTPNGKGSFILESSSKKPDPKGERPK